MVVLFLVPDVQTQSKNYLFDIQSSTELCRFLVWSKFVKSDKVRLASCARFFTEIFVHKKIFLEFEKLWREILRNLGLMSKKRNTKVGYTREYGQMLESRWLFE